MQYSFYGGQQGKSFLISAIFENKSELKADLNKRWSSSIGQGEFVIISYGLPDTAVDDSYNANATNDINIYGRTYNTTLWQKIYLEEGAEDEVYPFDPNNFELIFPDNATYGVAYKLIAAMTGNTPVIHLDTTEVLNADQQPYVTLDITNAERPVLTFHLPQAQQILSDHVVVTVEDVGTTPNVILRVTGTNSDGTLRINQPELEFVVPRSQKIDYQESTVLNADQDPTVDWEESPDVNNPKLRFNLPQVQRIISSNVHYSVLDAGAEPEFVFDTTGAYDNGDLRINLPEVTIKLPQSQTFGIADDVDILQPETAPYVTIDDTTDINNPTLTFHLPRMWSFEIGEVTTVAAKNEPQVNITRTETNDIELNFDLPRARKIVLGEVEVVSPQVSPSVTMTDVEEDEPKVNFKLPRAAKFVYGSGILGKRTADSYSLDLEDVASYDLDVGDYYIDEPTGFIYIVTNKTTSDITFRYLGCLQAPVPKVGVEEVDPYSADGSSKTPISVTSTYEDATEKTGWALEFSLPQIPDLEATIEALAPDDDATASVSPINSNTVNFDFGVPRGSRIFAGDEIAAAGVSVTITDTIDNGDGTTTTITAQNGDMYLNGDTGDIYILRRGVWMMYKGNLKGPKGDSLKIVLRLSFDSSNYTSIDDAALLLAIAEAFQEQFNRLPNEDELIAVTWTDKTTAELESSSYWYFYTEDTSGEKVWDRAMLTGSVSAMFFDEYTTGAGVGERGYTAEYINSLIGGNIDAADYNKKAFSVEQILALLEWGDMANADTDVYPPEPTGDHDTLSAEELLELLSWGDMASFALTDS